MISPYQDPWEETPSGTFVLKRDNYYISYNSSVESTFLINQELYNEDNDCEETALYIQDTGQYLILNGDFRNDYENCESLEECIAMYQKHAPLYRSKWSMD